MADLWFSSPLAGLCYEAAVFLESLVGHHTVLGGFFGIFPADRREEGDEVVFVISHVLSGRSARDRGVARLPDQFSALASREGGTYLMCWDEAKEVQLVRNSVKHTMPIWRNLPSGPVSI